MCGCGEKIVILQHHKYVGIPKFIQGHHPFIYNKGVSKYHPIDYTKTYICECGCGKEIKIQKHHQRMGIPKYIPGHQFRMGDISLDPYGYEFNEKLRQKVRNRDHQICQNCGKTHKEEGKKLSVHHIDYNKRNNFLWNLIALCSKCHLKTNPKFRREYWTEYYQRKMEIIINEAEYAKNFCSQFEH